MNQRNPRRLLPGAMNTPAPCSAPLRISSGYTRTFFTGLEPHPVGKLEMPESSHPLQWLVASHPRAKAYKAQLPCLEPGWTQSYNLCSKSPHRIRPSPGIHLKLYPCLPASPSLSCFPHSLTRLPGEHFLKKSLPLESVAQSASGRAQSKTLGILCWWIDNLGIRSFPHVHWTPLVCIGYY